MTAPMTAFMKEEVARMTQERTVAEKTKAEPKYEGDYTVEIRRILTAFSTLHESRKHDDAFRLKVVSAVHEILDGKGAGLELIHKDWLKGDIKDVTEEYKSFDGGNSYIKDAWSDFTNQANEDGKKPEVVLHGVTIEHKDMKGYLDDDQQGDGKLFADMFRGQVIYDVAAGKWFIWTGNYYEEDWNESVWNMVANQVAARYILASSKAKELVNDELSKKFYHRSRELKAKYRVENTLDWAWKQEGMSLRGGEWDSNQMLLGVGNGVIDLATGEFRTGRPTEYLRAHSEVDWNGINEPCPNFEKFVLEIMGNDTEMTAFMQRLFGYSTTGKDTEHVFPIAYGEEGRNGKTVIFGTVSYVLGKDLTFSAPADVLMDTKNSDGEAPKPFLYSLRGKRMVWLSESKQGQRLTVNVVKHITGGGEMTARTLHGKPITFMQTHTAFLMTNHRPHIPADDQAIWDRVLLIPFEQRFVDKPKEGEFKRDKDLAEKLKLEASGILAWLVRGCLEWQKQGLNAPERVRAATDAYKADEDSVQDFINECLITDAGINTTVQQIYNCYKNWSLNGGAEPMSRKALSKRLRTRFGEPEKTRDGFVFKNVAVRV